MPFSPQTLEDKPYNMCINCALLGKRCDGPNFLAMSVERWCEWCRIRKKYLGWSNDKLAELSGKSKNTIERVMAGTITGLSVDTMQAIAKALVNGTWGKYPCAMADENGASSELECQRLRAQHEDDAAKIAFLKEEITFNKKQILAKDKIISVLVLLLGICVATVLLALVIDATSHNLGFFWRR